MLCDLRDDSNAGAEVTDLRNFLFVLSFRSMEEHSSLTLHILPYKMLYALSRLEFC